MTTALELLEEAEHTLFGGWDFSWLEGRLRVGGLPWDFTAVAARILRDAQRALDMGTGGGEWPASMEQLPVCMVATESWEPNVPVASQQLRPLGVSVVRAEGAEDNALQQHMPPCGRLPFRNDVFDVIVNRHKAFVAAEVGRVLQPGGLFVTQQADPAAAQFHALLGLPPPEDQHFELDLAVLQLEGAGLTVEKAESAEEELRFGDVGALAWYLKAIPWCVPDFSIDRYRDSLCELHGDDIVATATRFWIRSRKRD